ncbi:hypothetical protein BDQ12DRAFT_708074 [Crucibulum laeve]|uniref:Uncharacterized protein n=1 Tax=Crucibulum laeve TaxID=68775 RepID=A0A5C3MH87_9AGAR|nr:hypothetical protein BDQ12DRAFT_708074 [Crucibulum laeve]
MGHCVKSQTFYGFVLREPQLSRLLRVLFKYDQASATPTANIKLKPSAEFDSEDLEDLEFLVGKALNTHTPLCHNVKSITTSDEDGDEQLRMAFVYTGQDDWLEERADRKVLADEGAVQPDENGGEIEVWGSEHGGTWITEMISPYSPTGHAVFNEAKKHLGQLAELLYSEEVGFKFYLKLEY